MKWQPVAAAVALVLLIVLGASALTQPKKEYVSEKDRIFAQHVAELRSKPTTEVVIPYGPEGYISHFWSESGMSSEYSLEEYKAAVVPLSEGADVGIPVEGDHFQVPWSK